MATVGWQPGPGKSDPNWYNHYTHVTQRGGKDSGLELLKSTAKELCEKLSREDFGALYGYLGVNVAKMGITRLNWTPKVGGMDHDPDWNSHYGHVAVRANKESGRDFLLSWFTNMHAKLDLEGFGMLYADCMVVMASFGITR
ncbi:MAG TPA: hypothetical protein VEY88_12310 [Archangium sp.]|nr:hypothetical protein [Archangium sp.]